MMLQLIRGKVVDEAQFRQSIEQWNSELGPTANGFLGATGGVLPDGTFIQVARFTNATDAAANSSSEAQTAWFNDFSKTVSDVSFADFDEATEWMGGGSNEAGFVQIITGRVTDRAALEAVESQAPTDVRGDIIGGTRAISGDRFLNVIYFTSEADARKGEQRPEMEGVVKAMQAATADVEYIDISNPILL